MHSVAVYQLSDRVLIHPWQQTSAGLGIASEPYVSLPPDAEPGALGRSVLAALSQAGRTLPHPLSWKGLDAPRLKAAGVRSERDFQAQARYVCVARTDKALRVEPTRNGGSKGDAKGFAPLPALGVTLPLDSLPEALGLAVRDALTKCT